MKADSECWAYCAVWIDGHDVTLRVTEFNEAEEWVDLVGVDDAGRPAPLDPTDPLSDPLITRYHGPFTLVHGPGCSRYTP
jgi:hypothetical protein